MKTYTPDLEPAVLDRLREFAAQFAADFPQAKPARWAGVYLQGLLLDGDRKSIEPLARRVSLPAGLSSKDPEQALQQFVNRSPWDEQAVLRRYRARLARSFAGPKGVFLIDDVSCPKQGEHSVGVQRPYGGALGKKANCQVAVSVHDVAPKGHFPLDLRLSLPESGQADPRRMDQAGVPAAERRSLTKPRIAPELLDRVRAEGLPGSVVVADAGDGVSRDRRDGLAARGRSDLVGVTADLVVFPAPPAWVAPKPSTGGRPQTRYPLAEGNPLPVRVGELAGRMERRKGTWREGTKGKLAARFAWVRVGPGHDGRRGGCANAAPVWLLLEEQTDGQLKFAVSNLPAKTNRRAAVRLWKSRWPVEQGYQQLKEELGLDHFEGRSWRGFHHPAARTFLAYGFLLLEKLLTPPAKRRRGKRGRAGDAPGHSPGSPAPPGSNRTARLPVLPCRPYAAPSNGVVLACDGRSTCYTQVPNCVTPNKDSTGELTQVVTKVEVKDGVYRVTTENSFGTQPNGKSVREVSPTSTARH